MTSKILHIVNWGDGFSGARKRAQYTLNHAHFAPGFRHALLSQKMRAHQARGHLTGTIEECFDGRYLNGLELPTSPRFLRRWLSRRALRRADPDMIVTWSWKSGQKLLPATPANLEIPGVLIEPGDMLYPSSFRNPSDYRCVVTGHHRVICNSHAAMRTLNVVWDIRHGIEVIPNPVDPGLLSGLPRQLPVDRELILGFAGRMVDIKGVPIAIHAVKELRDRGIACSLELAGGGSREPTYRLLAERLGIGHVCRFHGPLSDISTFYDSIDLLLVPSLCESFGLVSAEAAMRGCPVVASRTGGLPETIREGETGYTVPMRMPAGEYPDWGGNLENLPEWVYSPEEDTVQAPRAAYPRDLADAVANVVTDAETYASFSRNCIEHAQERFSMARHIDALNSLLEGVKGING